EGLQGIILTMNYNVDKFTSNLQQVIETICDVFKIKDIWKRVCIVWTKCFNHFSKDEIKKKKINKEKFKEKLTEFINQINKTNEYLDIPMYFVDSQPDERHDNSRSENEIERLIE
ncbi:AIG1 family protein, partial [Entamoeba histolytica KU27]